MKGLHIENSNLIKAKKDQVKRILNLKNTILKLTRSIEDKVIFNYPSYLTFFYK
jgi:hypothetical protein